MQLVSDLGQVFKLIGGSTGAFFIFMMPGAFLIQVGSPFNALGSCCCLPACLQPPGSVCGVHLLHHAHRIPCICK